ncbi:MAG: acetyl-CoA synthetase [Paracoccaceae bacterium]|jgi:acetyl-CoA synthetase|tara:strand:- start:621 stop:968 length:348 start_codon:yes stop_codon:yes gene_type:complete
MKDVPIKKSDKVADQANMSDAAATRADFSRVAARNQINGRPDGKLNICHGAVDRHGGTGHNAQIALRWIAKSGERTDFTYAGLLRQINLCAFVLKAWRIGRGDKVFSLLKPVSEH